MSCACRAVPWRAFVRGLAQVHSLDSPVRHATLAGLRSRPLVSSSGIQWVTDGRDLHTSPFRGQDAAAVAPPVTAKDELRPATVRAKKETSGRWRERETTQKRRSKEQARAKTASRDKKPRESKGAEKKSTAAGKPWTRQRLGSNPKADGAEAPRREEPWQVQKAALKEKFPEGWNPRKRLSPDALAGIRALNAQFPEVYTTQALADKFKVSPEAIRRILRSKWAASAQEEQDREDRWFRRGMQVWEHKAALGVKPPRRWRMEGIARDPGYHEWSRKVSQREREWEEEEIRKYREQRERARQEGGGGGSV